jgi:hypothetical protein
MTDLLFAMPSMLYGLARLLDIGGMFEAYNEMPDPAQADAVALYSDFRAVGEDLGAAIAQAAAEIDREPQLATSVAR